MANQTKTTWVGTGIFLLQFGAIMGLVKLISLTLGLTDGRTAGDLITWLAGYLVVLESAVLILVAVAGEAAELLGRRQAAPAKQPKPG